jgi:hypothetical protein
MLASMKKTLSFFLFCLCLSSIFGLKAGIIDSNSFEEDFNIEITLNDGESWDYDILLNSTDLLTLNIELSTIQDEYNFQIIVQTVVVFEKNTINQPLWTFRFSTKINETYHLKIINPGENPLGLSPDPIDIIVVGTYSLNNADQADVTFYPFVISLENRDRWSIFFNVSKDDLLLVSLNIDSSTVDIFIKQKRNSKELERWSSISETFQEKVAFDESIEFILEILNPGPQEGGDLITIKGSLAFNKNLSRDADTILYPDIYSPIDTNLTLNQIWEKNFSISTTNALTFDINIQFAEINITIFYQNLPLENYSFLLGDFKRNIDFESNAIYTIKINPAFSDKTARVTGNIIFIHDKAGLAIDETVKSISGGDIFSWLIGPIINFFVEYGQIILISIVTIALLVILYFTRKTIFLIIKKIVNFVIDGLTFCVIIISKPIVKIKNYYTELRKNKMRMRNFNQYIRTEQYIIKKSTFFRDMNFSNDFEFDTWKKEYFAGNLPNIKGEEVILFKKIKILSLLSQPDVKIKLDLRKLYFTINKIVDKAELNDFIELKTEPHVTEGNLGTFVQKNKSDIIIISCHGKGNKLLLEKSEESNEAVEVETERVAYVFNNLGDKIKLVILNSCDCKELGAEIQKEIDYVIGMNENISFKEAKGFLEGFLPEILENKKFFDSFHGTKKNMVLKEERSHIINSYYSNEDDAKEKRFFTHYFKRKKRQSRKFWFIIPILMIIIILFFVIITIISNIN